MMMQNSHQNSCAWHQWMKELHQPHHQTQFHHVVIVLRTFTSHACRAFPTDTVGKWSCHQSSFCANQELSDNVSLETKIQQHCPENCHHPLHYQKSLPPPSHLLHLLQIICHCPAHCAPRCESHALMPKSVYSISPLPSLLLSVVICWQIQTKVQFVLNVSVLDCWSLRSCRNGNFLRCLR